jgi:hypothetical protein
LSASEVKSIVEQLDEQLKRFLQKRLDSRNAGRKPEPLGLGTVSLMLPLYCNPLSGYYRDASLLPDLNEGMERFLETQLPSGCISLVNCNIDSPPDTAFTTHNVALLYHLALRSGRSEIIGVADALRTFLERAKPCLLTGGIHTPNHRWVMAGALAQMYEIFGDEAFRERAFQFLDEGFDITEYGEWTERSNAIYNSAVAIHLYDAGLIFQYEPAFEAIRSNLNMMRHMLHPDDSLVTEYSGRQDAGQVMKMNDWYYIVLHLMAARDQNPVFVSMAHIARRTAPRSPIALLYWMLMPEAMTIPEQSEPLSDHYTILYGENNEVPVRTQIRTSGRPVHPHGASVLRHRRGKLSVTAMAGQPVLLHVRYGAARLYGLKLSTGWFGFASVSFPSIKQVGENVYRMQTELEGCYFHPLPKALTEGTGGMYVKMPNHLREKSHVQSLSLTVEFTLHDDGVDVRVVSGGTEAVYLQAIAMFDADGVLEGDGFIEEAGHIRQLAEGEAVYSHGGDCIRLSSGAREHEDVSMRNERMDRDALNVTVNWVTPTDQTLRIRGFEKR